MSAPKAHRERVERALSDERFLSGRFPRVPIVSELTYPDDLVEATKALAETAEAAGKTLKSLGEPDPTGYDRERVRQVLKLYEDKP